MPDRRVGARARDVRVASWPEQRTQFVTRFFLVAVAFVYFNNSANAQTTVMPLMVLNGLYVLHLLINTFNYFHARRQLASVLRFRVALWADIVGISCAVLNDPYQIPPSLIAFVLVVLGNGMRYGMPLFIESLVGTFAGSIIALGLRQSALANVLTPGVLFLILFFVIILIYAFILVHRTELTRRQLEQRGSTDALTGLMNRRGLFEIAESLFAGVTRGDATLTVMFADLDKFKHINDNLGHGVGDRVLQQLAEILRGFIRASDIAARYGGDEFVLILSNTTLDQAEGVARRIQERVGVWSRDNGFECSVTLALAEAPTHGDSLSELLDCADQALYHSKVKRGPGGIERFAAGVGSSAAGGA